MGKEGTGGTGQMGHPGGHRGHRGHGGTWRGTGDFLEEGARGHFKHQPARLNSR